MITIVPMNITHVASVATLERICFSDPWSENSVASELDNPLSLWLVATEGTEVIGYIGSQSVMGESDMMNVGVLPKYRRTGVATKLINALIDALRQMQNHSLSLEVRASNAPAIALYEGMGFREVGRRRNYYRNPREDALILRKEWTV